MINSIISLKIQINEYIYKIVYSLKLIFDEKNIKIYIFIILFLLLKNKLKIL